MEVKIIKDEKEHLEIEIESLTIAELMRVYLSENGADYAVWKRDHPSKNPILVIKTKEPKKILKKTIEVVEKEIDNFLKEFKKLD